MAPRVSAVVTSLRQMTKGRHGGPPRGSLPCSAQTQCVPGQAHFRLVSVVRLIEASVGPHVKQTEGKHNVVIAFGAIVRITVPAGAQPDKLALADQTAVEFADAISSCSTNTPRANSRSRLRVTLASSHQSIC